MEVLSMELINKESSEIIMEDKDILFALCSKCDNINVFYGEML
jgi:hypothetical protein